MSSDAEAQEEKLDRISYEQAALILSRECTKIIQEAEQKLSVKKQTIIGTMLQPLYIVYFIVLLLHLTVTIYYNLTSNSFYLAEGLIIEFVLLLAIYVLVIFLNIFYSNKELFETIDRTKRYVDKIKVDALMGSSEVKAPLSKTVCVSRCLREGIEEAKNIPWLLLVKGDIVLLGFGDLVPAYCELVTNFDKDLDKKVYLQKGKIFRPDNLPIDILQKLCNEDPSNARWFKFRLLETPIVNSLKATLENTRPASLFRNQVKRLWPFIYTKVAIPIFCISLAFSLVRFILSTNRNYLWGYYLILQQISVIIPLLPPILLIIAILVHSLGTAEVMLLYEQLIQSATPFDDEAGVDAFDDEALPPVKDVSYASGVLFTRFIQCLTRKYDKDETVPFCSHTLESLSSTTVICSVDRAGTIAKTFPLLNELLFIDEKSAEPISLDIVEAPESANGLAFQEGDWRNYLPNLKPVGLNVLLNNQCSITQYGAKGAIAVENGLIKRRNELHGRLDRANLPLKQPVGSRTCQCALSREIGFQDEVLNDYGLLKRKTIGFLSKDLILNNAAKDEMFALPCLNLSFFKNKLDSAPVVPDDENILSVVDGDAQVIVLNCTDYWDGKKLCHFDDALKKKLIEFYENALINDLDCIAFSYTPVSQELKCVVNSTNDCILYKSMPAKSNADVPHTLSDLLHEQIFLCMGTLGYQPKEDVCDFIEDLKLGGIRFVYFSDLDQRESKAFAERLGLETDWNSCILLSNETTTQGYMELHDIKAKLPRGIENIRDHIKDVDDIPLHVSLFAECIPSAVADMIEILQENGEVVCCLGSSLNCSNTSLFSTADISICLEPIMLRSTHFSHSSVALASALTSLPVAFKLHSDISLYVVSQLIRDARTFAYNCTQGACFLIASYLTLSITSAVSNILFLPAIFVGFQLLWFQIVIIPLMSIPFFLSPVPMPEIMKQMPVKNKDPISEISKFFGYFALRFLPVVGLTIAIYLSSLSITSNNDYWWWKLNDPSSELWFQFGNIHRGIVEFSQAVAGFSFVFQICVVSYFFLHRTDSIAEFPPYKNRLYIPVFCFVMFLEVLFLLPFFLDAGIRIASLSWVFALVFVGPLLVAAFQEYGKSKDRKQVLRFQKRSKLEFNTKLGCYSPV